MENQWKWVNEDYQVSNFGDVRSFKIHLGGYVMKKSKSLRGYYVVGLNKKTHLIHQLVWDHFGDRKRTDIGTVKKGDKRDMSKLQIDHIDNNPLNNNITNLQLLTGTQNQNKRKKTKPPKIYKNKKPIKDNPRKYRCQFSFKGRLIYLGIYHTKDEVKKHKENFKNDKYTGKSNIYYHSQLFIKGKHIHLGWFKKKEDAIQKVKEYKLKTI